MRALAVVLISLAALAPGAGADSPVPGPDEALPRSPAPLAARLTEVSRALRDSIDRWRAAGIRRGPAPPEVQLGALYQQRVSRLLARRPGLSRRGLRRGPRGGAGPPA